MKKFIPIFLLLIILVLAIFRNNLFPIILNKNQTPININIQVLGDTIFPIHEINFGGGKTAAYLLISNDDISQLPTGIARKKVLKTTDTAVLKEMKRNFAFKRTNADMSTSESEILIYRNDTLVFRSNIILTDSTLGLQDSKNGWIESVDKVKLKEVFERFRPVNALFISL